MSTLRAGIRGAAVLGALVVLGAGLLSASCAKKIVDVDPDAFPEGVSSPSRLVMFRDAPNFVYVYKDSLPPPPSPPEAIGPSPKDPLIDIVSHYRKGSGIALGMLFDYTPADGYEIYRRESGGGYTRLKDFVLRPTRLWLDSQSEIYQFDDPEAGPMSRDYVGRGVVEHVVTPTAPLTNIAELGTGDPIGDEIQVTTDSLRLREDPADSTRGTIRSVEWTTAFGAAGYWLHVYQSTEQTISGLFARGFPSPVFTGRARDYLVAYLPAGSGPTARYDSTSISAGALVLMNRPIIYSQDYEVHVAAVDAQGRLISVIHVDPRTRPAASGPGLAGAIRGDALTQLVGREYDELYYGVYPLGSYFIPSEGPPLPGTIPNSGGREAAASRWLRRR